MKRSLSLFLILLFCTVFFVRISAQDTITDVQKKVETTVIDDKETDKKEVFMVVEESPEFPGGEEARISFMFENTNYPQEARESGIQGTVYVSFIVEPDGSITNINILRGIGGGCDEEVIRMVKMMPKWKPGIQKGKPVRVSFNMPVKFTLESGNKPEKTEKPQKTLDRKQKDKLLF